MLVMASHDSYSVTPPLSPDGRWWWDGVQWQPVPASTPTYAPPPSPGRAEGLAVASLVLSLFWIGGLGSVGAVVCGHLARSRARRSGNAPSGLALAGLVIGYVGVALTVLMVALFVIVAQSMGDSRREMSLRTELRHAAMAQEMWMTDTGTYSRSVERLVAAGYYDGDPTVRLSVFHADSARYCLAAQSVADDERIYLTSGSGEFSSDPCH